MLPVLNLETAV
ncbi:unnamed protein product [Ranitomeya imitator]|uniref:Uncharacterized protein n=1 Tax=Ranitomeya imitator TaxID=111125 RepID=A0ABN9M360_9NEOB|nr:unnamed protein product [Ranitomeya imitator]